MLRVFDGGYPGSRTWEGEHYYTVSRLYTFITIQKIKKYFISRLCTYKIKKFCFELAEYVSPFCTHITVFKLQKKYFSYVQTTKKPRLQTPAILILS